MKQTDSNSQAGWVLVLLLLLVAGCVLYLAWRRQEEASAPRPVTVTTHVADELLFGGMPRPLPGSGEATAVTVLTNRAYAVGYSESRRNPLWAAYRVFHTDHPYSSTRPSTFSTDSRTLARVRASDYTASGYDRGHLAPNSAIVHDFGKEAQLETFLLSNICPQTPALNERVWERLEEAERKYADKCEEVWVIDGPIFADLNGGKTERLASGIAIPTAFYKILIDEEGHKGGAPRIFSVIMPQSVKGTELPQEFLTTVDEIEKETRFDFFPALDEATQAELESKVFKMW